MNHEQKGQPPKLAELVERLASNTQGEKEAILFIAANDGYQILFVFERVQRSGSINDFKTMSYSLERIGWIIVFP